jgi:hypothetical protein
MASMLGVVPARKNMSLPRSVQFRVTVRYTVDSVDAAYLSIRVPNLSIIRLFCREQLKVVAADGCQ